VCGCGAPLLPTPPKTKRFSLSIQAAWRYRGCGQSSCSAGLRSEESNLRDPGTSYLGPVPTVSEAALPLTSPAVGDPNVEGEPRFLSTLGNPLDTESAPVVESPTSCRLISVVIIGWISGSVKWYSRSVGPGTKLCDRTGVQLPPALASPPGLKTHLLSRPTGVQFRLRTAEPDCPMTGSVVTHWKCQRSCSHGPFSVYESRITTLSAVGGEDESAWHMVGQSCNSATSRRPEQASPIAARLVSLLRPAKTRAGSTQFVCSMLSNWMPVMPASKCSLSPEPSVPNQN
jgi:hypothetical protein